MIVDVFDFEKQVISVFVVVSQLIILLIRDNKHQINPLTEIVRNLPLTESTNGAPFFHKKKADPEISVIRKNHKPT